MSISTVAVIGAGQMGSGIAQVAATSGTAVILSDSTYELAERGSVRSRKHLPGQWKKADSARRRVRQLCQEFVPQETCLLPEMLTWL